MPPRGFHKIRCAQGHLFNEANVLLIQGDRRSCRECRRLYDAERHRTASEARAAKLAHRESVLDALTERQLAYLAGLVDGEGSISASFRSAWGRSGPNVSLVLSIVMATQEPLATIAGWLDGLQRPLQEGKWDPQHRRRWCWRLHGTAAAALLRRLRPYLILKTEQADLAIHMDSLRAVHGGRRGPVKLPTHLLRELTTATDRMHALNRRGVDKEVA